MKPTGLKKRDFFKKNTNIVCETSARAIVQEQELSSTTININETGSKYID